MTFQERTVYMAFLSHFDCFSVTFPLVFHPIIMFLGAPSFDAQSHILKIIANQSLFYCLLGIFLGVLDIFLPFPLIPEVVLGDQLFSYGTLTGYGGISVAHPGSDQIEKSDSFAGFLTSLSYILTAVTLGLCHYFIVERSKKCLDFAFTTHMFHLLFCFIFSGIPLSWIWWWLQISCILIETLIGRKICAWKETQPISI